MRFKALFSRISAENIGLLLDGHALDAAFVESDHPRGQPENAGEFASKGSGQASHSLTFKDKKWISSSNEPVPKHIAKLRIPPAWTNVIYNPDPKGAWLVKGRDAAGRSQQVRNEKADSQAQKEKFRRIQKLDRKIEQIKAQVANDRKKQTRKEFADCMALILETGIRPGRDADRQAKVKAFGASTLLGSHVQITPDATYLDFIGKKGVHIHLPVSNPDLAEMLKKRKSIAGDNGRLFNTNDDTLLKYSKSLGGNSGFLTKDFRTRLGTSIAQREVEQTPRPTSEKAYKAAVKAVAIKVAAMLGNTPSVALQRYIDPLVFSDWREALAA